MEEFAVLVWWAGKALAVRAQELEAGDVAAECATAMVIFAVYVVGDGATDWDEFGARWDWQKPAAWHEDIEDFGQGYACFAA